jgi:hypothetical protein
MPSGGPNRLLASMCFASPSHRYGWPMPPKLPPETRTSIERLLTGTSLTQVTIAKRCGVSPTMVSGVARSIGISPWAGSQNASRDLGRKCHANVRSPASSRWDEPTVTLRSSLESHASARTRSRGCIATKQAEMSDGGRWRRSKARFFAGRHRDWTIRTSSTALSRTAF